MWSFGELRNGKQPICKKSTLKKVKNGGNNRVGVILQNSKPIVHGRADQSQIVLKKQNTSVSNLLLDLEKRSILGTIHEEEEEEEEIQQSVSINGKIVLHQTKEDVDLACESVRKKMHQYLCHNVMDADTTLSSVPKRKLVVSRGHRIFQRKTLNSIFDAAAADDDNDDDGSEDIFEDKGVYTCDSSSRGTTSDSFAECREIDADDELRNRHPQLHGGGSTHTFMCVEEALVTRFGIENVALYH